MSDLDSRCRALVEAGRLGDEPSFEDEHRVRQALASRIAAAAVVGTAVGLGVGTKAGVAVAAGKAAKAGAVIAAGSAGTAAAAGTTAVASGFLLKFVGIGMAAGLVTVGVAQMVPTTDSQQPARTSATSAATVQQAVNSVESTPAPVVSPTESLAQPETQELAPVEANPPPKQVSSAASTSTLDAEMQLIRSAQRALHSGQPATALAILGDHARQFPRGHMSEDRVALQVLALCASGRSGDAKTQAARFMATHPKSPYAGPVSSCASVPPPLTTDSP